MQILIIRIWYRLVWTFAVGLCLWVLVGCHSQPLTDPRPVVHMPTQHERLMEWGLIEQITVVETNHPQVLKEGK